MTTVEATPSTGIRSTLLFNRNFLLLWAAYGVSAMGDHLSEMALLKTQDSLSADVDVTPLTARMTFMFFVPFFMLAPVAGALADRFSRRGLMVFSDVIRCVAMFFFASLIAVTQSWGSWGAFLPLVLIGAFAAIFSPARSALLPTLIRPDQLVRANGMIGGLGIIATMAAAKVGGYLAKFYEPTVAFRWDAASFVASAILLLCIHRPINPQERFTPARSTRTAGWNGFVRGFRYVRAHRRVRELLIIAALVWFCGPIVSSVIPAVVRDVYELRDYSNISSYRALLGLGFIIGAVTIMVLGDSLRGTVAIVIGMFGIAASMAVFAASALLPLVPSTAATVGGVGVVAAGAFGLTIMASFLSLLQRIVANRFRGRVFGVNDVCTTSALLIATGFLGLPNWTRLDRWVGWLLVTVAAVMLLSGCVTLTVHLRRSSLSPIITLAAVLNEFVAKFWWRLQRIGVCTVPRTGPVIVTANHVSTPDPSILSAAIYYRPLSFIIAAEYAGLPIVRSIVKLIDCIPVRREERDAGATKKAIHHLELGKALGIFIEGGIFAPDEPRRPKDGVAMLALRTGATVVPAYISGMRYHPGMIRGIIARHHARVRFGKPVDLTEFRNAPKNRETVRRATSKIYAAIQSLAPLDAAPTPMLPDAPIRRPEKTP